MDLAPVSSLIRATLFVRDLDRATAFYRALGLSETYYEGVLDDPSANAIIGYDRPGPLSVRIIKRPGPNFGMIGLFKMDDALGAEVVPMATGPARVGEVAIIFYVRSMADTLGALRAAGATWSPEPAIFRMAHRQQAEVCLRDCDGVLINLVETDPAQQERTRPELDYA
ncbi:MAG: VOC family protein [Azospirillaceae bacterium]|nr:VOC family protein [Azospirillaceae bacterium]